MARPCIFGTRHIVTSVRILSTWIRNLRHLKTCHLLTLFPRVVSQEAGEANPQPNPCIRRVRDSAEIQGCAADLRHVLHSMILLRKYTPCERVRKLENSSGDHGLFCQLLQKKYF